MKKVALLFSFLVISLVSNAQWAIDKGHSKFTFIAEHHGISEVDGYFKKFDGKITASKDDFLKLLSSRLVSIPTLRCVTTTSKEKICLR